MESDGRAGSRNPRGEDAGIRTTAHEHLAWVGIYRGDLAFAAEHASASRQWARRTTDPATRAESLSTFAMVEFLSGRPAQDLMTEAVLLEDLAIKEGAEGGTTLFTASRTCHGLQLLWAGQLDAAREVLHQELTGYERLGRYVVRAELLTYLAEVECRAGNWDAAARHAQESYDIDIEAGWVLGLGHTLFPKALVAALMGDVEAARADAEEGLRQSLRNEDTLDASCNRAVLGFLELSLSNPTAAIQRLEPVLAFLDELGSPEPGIIPCLPDAIEALVLLGRLDAAEGLLDRLERQGRALDRPWAIASAARCRGLLTAARGELPAASSALEQALVEHRRAPQPFELARTLLVKGEVERRAKQKRAARSTLGQALELFQTLGAPLWAQRARDDLARVGGAALPSSGLTPTEQRIAQLVVEGRKNREVADAMFISVKTVEANLSRISTSSGSARAPSSPAGSPTPPASRPRLGFPPIPRRSTGPSLLSKAAPIARSEEEGHGASDSNRPALRAGLAAHRRRCRHGVRHGGRRGRRGRPHDGRRASRR